MERRLHKSQMNMPSDYRADNPVGSYVKTRPRRRHRKHPVKGIKNVKRFEILKKAGKTAVLLVAPETGRLPEDMGSLARYISGKSGGLGEVVSALSEGLRVRGINCHLATLNLKKRFQEESGMDEHAWRQVRYKVDPDTIHLVSSSIYANLPSAYAGNPLSNAAEFQKELVNNTIKTARARSGGMLIVHSHDWMAGGVVTAYAKSRDCPVLHTVHNVHTGHIPLDMLFGVDIDGLTWNIYFSKEQGRTCIDSQATAIKSATLVNFVGERFLREIIEDYFLDRSFIPPSVRQEVKEKYNHGAAFSIINAPSPRMYPERCGHLIRKYDPDDDVMTAKRENLVEFQKRTGLIVNPDAILLYWPSRLDETQKGCELLEDIALKFVIENGDVQIAVVGNGVEGDRKHEEIMGRIACASGGKITYQRFSEPLSMLGYAAASDVFGASLYEPCGQIDQIGNLFGATATNRDTGGYHDKIKELQLSRDGASCDTGNGFLFCNYDPGGLWHGLSRSVQFHRRLPEVREQLIKRIMREARKRYSLDTMVDEYVKVYERLNGRPLN
ncbi:MAG: glycogen synthase [Syntrophales bacterium]